MIKETAIAAALLLLPAQVDPPAATGGEVIERLLGQWQGEGELFGQPARFSMRWERALDSKFVRLSFENRIVANGRARTVLEAVAYYRPAGAGALAGHWFDTRGQILDLEAEASDSTLVTRWSNDTEAGRTTYRVNQDGTVTVLDEVRAEDGWRPFGRASYRRN